VRKVSYVILWLLVLLLLVLNGIFLAGLWKARQAALDIMDEGLQVLSRLEDETFETKVRVQQTIPVRATVPFRRELKLPVNVSVPISHEISFQETFEIVIDTPAGEQSVKVPISASVPLSLTIPVKARVPVVVSETIPVRTDVEIDVKVPVAIKVADTPLLSYLEEVEALLAKVRRRISFGQE
jgi:hypothetical protein